MSYIMFEPKFGGGVGWEAQAPRTLYFPIHEKCRIFLFVALSLRLCLGVTNKNNKSDTGENVFDTVIPLLLFL